MSNPESGAGGGTVGACGICMDACGISEGIWSRVRHPATWTRFPGGPPGLIRLWCSEPQRGGSQPREPARPSANYIEAHLLPSLMGDVGCSFANRGMLIQPYRSGLSTKLVCFPLHLSGVLVRSALPWADLATRDSQLDRGGDEDHPARDLCADTPGNRSGTSPRHNARGLTSRW